MKLFDSNGKEVLLVTHASKKIYIPVDNYSSAGCFFERREARVFIGVKQQRMLRFYRCC